MNHDIARDHCTRKRGAKCEPYGAIGHAALERRHVVLTLAKIN